MRGVWFLARIRCVVQLRNTASQSPSHVARLLGIFSYFYTCLVFPEERLYIEHVKFLFSATSSHYFLLDALLLHHSRALIYVTMELYGVLLSIIYCMAKVTYFFRAFLQRLALAYRLPCWPETALLTVVEQFLNLRGKQLKIC
jgi:hypothetical protein